MSTFEVNVRRVFLELGDLLLERHKKYGPSNVANSPGGAMTGVVVRLHDKLSRLAYGVDNHADESLEDTLMDVAGYGAIGLLVSRGLWPK